MRTSVKVALVVLSFCLAVITEMTCSLRNNPSREFGGVDGVCKNSRKMCEGVRKHMSSNCARITKSQVYFVNFRLNVFQKVFIFGGLFFDTDPLLSNLCCSGQFPKPYFLIVDCN